MDASKLWGVFLGVLDGHQVEALRWISLSDHLCYIYLSPPLSVAFQIISFVGQYLPLKPINYVVLQKQMLAY